ncbi:MAG: magnesium/cobalt transporter CorA [Sumerlaeia bacterium]
MSIFRFRKNVQKLIPLTIPTMFRLAPKAIFRSRRNAARPGIAPGIFAVPENANPTEVSAMRYVPEGVEEFAVTQETDLSTLNPKTQGERVWLNISGLQNSDWIRRIAEHFSIHPLVLEDIFESNQRAKLDYHDERLFLVARMVDGNNKIPNEKVSFYLDDRVLITFQERNGDIFDPVRERLRIGRGRIRTSCCDYLLYALLDTIIDHYLLLIEQFDDQAEILERSIIHKPTQSNFQSLHDLKISIRHLQRQFRPHRAMVEELISKSEIEGSLIEKDSKIFFHDCLDHAVVALDHFDRLHDELSSLMDLYHSIISNKMNEIMKVLTLVSALFIPLTFVTGLYGMNFNSEISPFNMPELNMYYGYPAALLAMLITSTGLLVFFRRKGWL